MTPFAPRSKHVSGPLGEQGTPLPLRSLQRWFANAVTTPEPGPVAAAPGETESRLTAGPSLDARARLEIYRRAYHSRLIECLLDDYPGLRAALGESAFEALCRAYIAEHPSDGPSLNSFGRGMSRFCRESPLPSVVLECPRDFLADLAALEWAIVEVIHAPTAESFSLQGMADLPVDRWARARVVATPALRMLRSQYPVNAFFQSFRDGESPLIPAPERAATVVYRSGPTVWRMDFTEPMFDLLKALFEGESLGVSLEQAASAFAGIPEEAAVQRVTTWFRDWVASGLFAGIDCA